MSEEIDIFKCLDFMRDNAPAYAKAKADRVELEQFRKSKKALLMREAESKGFTALAAQEREAYADDDYVAVIKGLGAAVQEEERLRWLLITAQIKLDVWRTIEANRRAEAKVL